MIDGIQFTFHTSNPKTHLLGLECWEISVNEKTGQRVNDTRYTHLRGLDIRLKPSMDGGYNLLVNGSFHKFHNCGEHNADQFTFSKLVQSIDSFIDLFCIDANECELHGLEIGVNINLPYSPLKVLKNLVCYRSKLFTQINKNNIRKGFCCGLKQYAVKVYDKEKTNGVACGNVLRFEVSITKMQAVKEYGIKTLADLQQQEKVYPFINFLQETLRGIVWTDNSVNLNLLTDRQQKQWLSFSNPKVWAAFNKYKRKRALNTWQALLKTYGKPPDLMPLVTNTWKELFRIDFEAQNPLPIYQSETFIEAVGLTTFLPLECTVKKLHPLSTINSKSNTGFFIVEKEYTSINNSQNKRRCRSCGKDISKQNKRSIFCSENIYGRSAKKCRNVDSNKRRNKKNKIQKAMYNSSYLAITYIDENGNTFTDILHPSEINATKEWLDRIKRVTILQTNDINCDENKTKQK